MISLVLPCRLSSRRFCSELSAFSLALSPEPVCCRFSLSLIPVSLCFHNPGDLPCKSVLRKRPYKTFSPSPWIFPSCPRHSTHLSPLLVSFAFVCLPPPSLFLSSFAGPVGTLPSMAHNLPHHPPSRSIFTDLSGPQLSLSFPSTAVTTFVPYQLISGLFYCCLFLFFLLKSSFEFNPSRTGRELYSHLASLVTLTIRNTQQFKSPSIILGPAK